MDRTEREERFTALARTVAEPVRRYVVRRVPRDLADDVVADVLLVLWRRLDDVPGVEPLPWCYGVARGCVANARRGERRRADLVERVARLDPPRPVDADVDPDPAVAAALARLSGLDREVVRLWAWEGLAAREIAVALDLTANAVSLRLSRARKRLADLLQDDRMRRLPDTDGVEGGPGE